MKKLITLLFFGCLLAVTATSQIVYNLNGPATNPNPGDVIQVEFTVDNFTDVIGFQYEIGWDDNVLQFQNITTHDNIMCFNQVTGNPEVCWTYPGGFGPIPITDHFVVSHIDTDPTFSNLFPNTLANGTKILTIDFLVIGAVGQSSPVSFEGSPGSTLAINTGFSELSIANNQLVANGTTVNIGTSTSCTGNGNVRFTASNESGDTGTTGSIKISVDNFDTVEGFQFDLNWDPSIIQFTSVGNLNLAGLVNVPPPAVGSFGTSQASNGTLFVSWENSAGVTACDGDVIFELFYNIIGAGGTDTDVDFVGNIEVIQNSTLANQVTNDGSVNVTGSGTGGGTNVTFDAAEVTGDEGTVVCVPVTVSNFNDITSFQYEVSWDQSILNYNSIVDANGNPLALNTPANPLNMLNPNPPAVGNFGTTNTSNGVLSVSWDNSAGQTIPTNNLTIYQICYDVVGTATQTSSIDFGGVIEVANTGGIINTVSTISGEVEVSGTPPPFNGLSVEWDCCSVANPGDQICVPVTVIDGFDNIISMQYAMTWDPAVLSYSSILDGGGNALSPVNPTTNPLGLSAGTNLVPDAAAGEIKLIWWDNFGIGVSVADEQSIYQVCFDVVGNVGSSTTLEMGALPNAVPPFTVEVANQTTTINFQGQDCTVNVQTINPLSVTETLSQPTCNGNDGAIDITVAGGIPAYTITWSTGATTEDISGLAPGSYTVTIVDECGDGTITQTFTLASPTPVNVTGTVQDVSAAGNDGSINLTTTGGSGNYTSYTWNPNVSTSSSATGLAPGNYSVTVTDSDGCTGTNSFTVNDACSPITVTGTVTHETGAGSDGTINTTVTGGTGQLTYTWNPNVGSTGNVSGLAAGNYTLTVTDVNGCTGTNTFTIDGFVCPTITVNGSVTNETSAGNDGAISLNVSGGSGNYTSYAWTPNVSTSSTANGLAAGNYSVIVTDSDGCTGTNSFTVNGFTCPTITVNGSGTHVTCAGGNDGTVSANANGGTAPYTYAWSNTMSGQNLSNLIAGTYTVTATDADGCQGTATVTVNDGISLNLNVTNQSNLSCNLDGSGSITVAVNGGTGNYTYNWNPNVSSSATASGLSAGTYNVTATDGNGCQVASGPISISQPLPLNVVATVTDASCSGAQDGSITLNISGGTPGYTVNWSEGSTGTTINGLAGGTITATVTDANNCTFSDVYTVVQPNAFTVSLAITNETIAGGDGAINSTVTPNGNYSYAWSSNNGFTSVNADINNLVSDVYTVVVTDLVTGCTVSQVGSVTNSLGIQTAITDDIDCNGESTGSINLTTVGGELPYSWLWSTSAGSASTEDVFNVPAGTHTVTITDALGVQLVETYTLTEPSPITITNFTIVDETNICNGSINIEVAGGVTPYEYMWNTTNGNLTAITVEDPIGLCEGAYKVTITDANDCVFISDNFIVNASLPQIGSVSQTDALCSGECDGTLSVDIVGGNEPYTVDVTDSANMPMGSTLSQANTVGFGGLCPGSYTVKITDSDGLMTTSNVIVIDEPAPITVSNVVIQNQSAAVCDGGISITIDGGVQPYSFVWSNGSTAQNPTDLCMGDYLATVTDANGCFIITPTYTVGKDINFSFDVLDVNCFGESNGAIDLEVFGGVPPYTYNWEDAAGTQISTDQDLNGYPTGEYTVMITDNAGTQVFSGTLLIAGPSAALEIAQIFTLQPSIGDCADGGINIIIEGGTPYTTNPNYDFIWEDDNGSTIATTQNVDNLTGGTYHVTVSDTNGCSEEATIILDGCELDAFISKSDITCNSLCDGTINVTVNQGSSPYNYQWDDGAVGAIRSDLCAGTYSFTVTDQNGVTGEQSVIITEPAPIEVTITTSPGRAEAVVIGGTAPYVYQWDTEITTDPFVDSLSGATEHWLQVTDDNGCMSDPIITTFRVPYDAACLTARSVISPNGDDKNEVFFINCAEDFTLQVNIYNRWGQEVFRSESYNNTWAGTDRRGAELPEGGYFYVLQFEDANGVNQTVKGSISIIR